MKPGAEEAFGEGPGPDAEGDEFSKGLAAFFEDERAGRNSGSSKIVMTIVPLVTGGTATIELFTNCPPCVAVNEPKVICGSYAKVYPNCNTLHFYGAYVGETTIVRCRPSPVSMIDAGQGYNPYEPVAIKRSIVYISQAIKP